MQIIKDRQIVDDTWQILPTGSELPPHGDYFVDLTVWNDDMRAQTRDGKVAPLLRPGDDVAKIRNLSELTVIAIEFPKFTDGRGYSMARLLRDRYAFKGDIRAVGNVLRDQLLYMQRCGFTEYALQPGKDIQGALEAFDELPVKYQAAVDVREPLFRRVQRA